jgi:hypothetical protein
MRRRGVKTEVVANEGQPNHGPAPIARASIHSTPTTVAEDDALPKKRRFKTLEPGDRRVPSLKQQAELENVPSPGQIEFAKKLRIVRTDDEALRYGKAALSRMISMRLGQKNRSRKAWASRTR